MNPWLWGALALLAGVVPCGVAVIRQGFLSRLVAVELGSTLLAQALLVLAVGFGHTYLVDIVLALVLLSFPGSLVFAHYWEHLE